MTTPGLRRCRSRSTQMLMTVTLFNTPMTLLQNLDLTRSLYYTHATHHFFALPPPSGHALSCSD